MLRGLDPHVDRAVLPYEPTDGPAARRRARPGRLRDALVKDEWEIAQLQDACDITVLGFEDVARVLPADRGVPERWIEGVFALRARAWATTSATTRSSAAARTRRRCTGSQQRRDHARRAGAARHGRGGRNLYTADVTRTLPVDGTFTPLQRELYDLVYAAQQAGIDAVKPGVPFLDVHQAACGCSPTAWTTWACCR